MPLSVHIRGGGIAAWACARLLERSGFAVSVERPRIQSSRWILVTPPAERLLVQISGDRDLLRDAPRIDRRTVAWGSAEPVILDHSAAVADEGPLLDRLLDRDWSGVRAAGTEPDWTVVATGMAGSQEPFGSRTASVSPVELRGERQACWIESLEHGWLFLVAGREAAGSLIAVGEKPATLLDSSRSIAPLILRLGECGSEGPAYPRIAPRLSGANWLACGSAAMALDPLCGDGAGHALREAILATAVLRGIARGGEAASLIEHYESRLLITFERHLDLCRGFYRSGRGGPWWDREIALLDRGLEWTRARPRPQWRYKLEGLDLTTLS